MKKTKLVALTVAALAVLAGPVAAPAQAAASHPCQIFADPYDTPCQLAIEVYCWIFPDQTICP